MEKNEPPEEKKVWRGEENSVLTEGDLPSVRDFSFREGGKTQVVGEHLPGRLSSFVLPYFQIPLRKRKMEGGGEEKPGQLL